MTGRSAMSKRRVGRPERRRWRGFRAGAEARRGETGLARGVLPGGGFDVLAVMIRRESAPARRGQAGGLFETAGEVALVGESALGGDLGQRNLALGEHALGVLDLAGQQEVLG